MYALNTGSGFSDAFLLEHVFPGIGSRLLSEVLSSFYLQLLFALFAQGSDEGFPEFCDHVKNAYNSLVVTSG